MTASIHLQLVLVLMLLAPTVCMVFIIVMDRFKTRCFLKSHYWCSRCHSFKTCDKHRFVKTPNFI